MNAEQPEPNAPAPKRRLAAKRLARAIAHSLSWLLVFVLATVLGVVVHLNTPLMRQAAGGVLNTVLADLLYGQIRVERFTHLTATGFGVSRVEVIDEQGQAVIVLESLNVDLDTWDDLWDLALGGNKISLVLPHTRAERAFVRILPDESRDGQPTLVRAFEPRPGEKKEPKEPEHPARHIRLFLQSIELGQVRAELGYNGTEQLSPVLSRVRGSVLVSPKGVAVDVPQIGVNLGGLLPKDIRGTGTYKLRSPGPMEASINGFAGDAEVQASMKLQDGDFEFDAVVPSAEPDAVRELLPQWPFNESVSAQATAKGPLEEMKVEGEASVGETRVILGGKLALSPAVVMQLSTDVRRFDLRTLDASWPATAIDAEGLVKIDLTEDEPQLVVDAKTQATEIAQVPIPPVELTAQLRDGEISGEARILEPDSTLHTDFRIGKEIEVNASVSGVSLANQRRLPKGLRGVTSLKASAKLVDGSLNGYANGTVTNFGTGPVDIRNTQFEVRSKTDLDKPEDTQLDVKLKTQGLSVDAGLSEPLAFQDAQISARGSRQGASVEAELQDEDGRRVKLKTKVTPELTFKDASFSIRQRRVKLSGEIEHLDLEKQSVNLTKISIEGAGKHFEGRLRLRPGLVEGRFEGEELRLGLVASALGLPRRTLGGTLSLFTDLSIGSDLSKARLRAEIKDASYQGWGDTDLQLFAELRGQDVKGNLTGKDGIGISFAGSWQTQLAGGALELDSWRAITGTGELRVLGIPLTGAELLAPKTLAHVDGEVGARFLIQRVESGLPTVFSEVGVSNLQIALKQDDKDLPLPTLSPYVSAVFDGGQRTVHGSGVIHDAHGQLLTATVSFPFDPLRFLEQSDAATAELLAAPISMAVSVPRRSITRLPLLDLEGQLQGDVDLQATLHQSLNDPRVTLQANAHDLDLTDSRNGMPLSFSLRAEYAPNSGDLDANVIGSTLGRTVIRGGVNGSLPMQALSGKADWDVDSTLWLAQFPLAIISPLADRGLRGNVSGNVDIDTKNHELKATLDLNDLSSGRAVLGKGTLFVSGKPGHIGAQFNLAGEGRFLKIMAHANGRDDHIPLPHHLRSVSIVLESRKLNAAALSPFLEGVLARVNGDVTTPPDQPLELLLVRQPALPGELPYWTSSLKGAVELRNGSAYVDALGLELRDISADVLASPAGRRSAITISDIQAKARSEKVNLEASASFLLEDGSIESGNARALLRSVPITLEGLNLGSASGQATANFQRTKGWDVEGPHFGKDYMLFEVDLNYWRMKAARTVARNLIDLDGNPDIIVVQHEKPATDPSEIMPYRIVVRLNQDVAFSLAELNIPMSGKTRLDYTDKARMTGTINLLPGGRLPILGRVFNVTNGKITLNPKQPSNPSINLNLVGRSSTGEAVYVTIAGTVSDPVLEPPPSELQSLLGAGNLLSGGVQALGVNDLLGDFELLGGRVKNLELRVSSDTERADNQSYSAAVQIGEKIWLEGTVQTSRGNGINATESETVQTFTIDYRFHPNWSLKTNAGKSGGSVDLQWQYRY